MGKINTVIIGASGYTGAELLRLALPHPNIHISALVAASNAGKQMGDLYNHFNLHNLPTLQKFEDVDWANIDLAFSCLPHAQGFELLAKIPDSVKIIDLSADFRLKNVSTYEQWYNVKHTATQLLDKAVYGLTETYRDNIAQANLVACPGCYPTSILLPILPLLQAGIIDGQIIADSKSGATGAGRALRQHLLFNEVDSNFHAYSIVGHRHKAEMLEQLGDKADISFVPHLLPIKRGILSTIYVKGDINAAKQLLTKTYANEPFVHVMDNAPGIKDAVGSNNCIISVQPGQLDGYFTIISVIDNLIKGSSGQAIQNMNIMFGLNETTGLPQLPLVP